MIHASLKIYIIIYQAYKQYRTIIMVGDYKCGFKYLNGQYIYLSLPQEIKTLTFICLLLRILNLVHVYLTRSGY